MDCSSCDYKYRCHTINWPDKLIVWHKTCPSALAVTQGTVITDHKCFYIECKVCKRIEHIDNFYVFRNTDETKYLACWFVDDE